MGNDNSTEEGASTTEADAGGRAAAAAEEEQPQQMGYWEMAKVGYQELVNAIIRPPRAEYEEQHLGPKKFNFGGEQVRRHCVVRFSRSPAVHSSLPLTTVPANRSRVAERTRHAHSVQVHLVRARSLSTEG